MVEFKFEARDYGYTVISKFESIFRKIINNKLQEKDSDFRNVVPSGVIAAAALRNDCIETLEELLEYIDFIHIKDIVLYKDNYVDFFNTNNLDKQNFSKTMDSLYNSRCKIAHIRGYFAQMDFSLLLADVRYIVDKLYDIPSEFIHFIDKIEFEPEKLVIKVPIDFYTDKVNEYSVLNNLPMGDYEYEGGFVGREDDKEKIIKMIKGGKHRVITIAGAGGVGKSALTLNIVNEIIRNDIIKYDFVIWISAKENKLSYLGIEDIEPTLRDYEELLNTILYVVGLDINDYSTIEKKEEDINILFDSCDRILIVIDNLETIRDERIINFILDSHPKANFLITSRTGLGQVERRYDLKELKEKEAVRLFRVICNDKHLNDLLKLDNNIVKHYVNKVYCYPLAIKWVLGQVAIGKDLIDVIEKINESSSDISLFCFEQIYNDISDEARKVLCTLSLYDDSVPKGVLKYISNLKEEVFEDTVKELILVSLIIPEQVVNKENSEINTYYSLLPLTRGYVKTQLDCNKELKSQLQDRLLSVDLTLEEAEKAKSQYRFSLSNLGAITEDEKVAAVLAQTGYQKYLAGNYPEAVEFYKRAIEIAPRLASIYRNWAIMESMEQHNRDADVLMEKAANLSPNDTQIWLSWGNMKRKSDKIKEACQYYAKAFELSPEDNVVLNSYAQAISRLGDYKRADELFRKALAVGNDISNNKHLIINHTSIAENLRKWAESLIANRDYDNALFKIQDALKSAEVVLKVNKHDSKGNVLYRNILYTYGVIEEKRNQYNEAIKFFTQITELPDDRYKEMEIKTRASLELAEIYIRRNEFDKAKKYISRDIEKNVKRINKISLSEKLNWIQEIFQNELGRKYGQIIRVNVEKKYIIIEVIGEDGTAINYLTFLSEFKEYVTLSYELVDKKVSFIPTVKGHKYFATQVKFVL